MYYFRELQNLEYQSFLKDRKTSNEYLLVKNLFRRVKLRDDLNNVFTIFDKYQIPDGSRPDLVAEEL
ncbi:MAG: Synechococcus phage, partial [Bacteroidota bacterium]